MPTLEWIGKSKVINHHQEVPFRVLERQYSYDEQGQHEEDNGSENMIIRGDNLEALKALLPRYERRVKCIYIDPPYNTGNEGWVYNDNVNDPKIKKWLGEVVGKEGEDLTRHDKWLCMMYPRLKLLQKLLAEDGAIFISIDDNELYNLKAICDEIFGQACFVGNISWQRTYSMRNDSKGIPSEIEHILVYSKHPDWVPNKLPRTEEMDSKYKNPDNDPLGPWQNTTAFAPGGASHQGMVYAIQHPFTGKMIYPTIDAHWRYQQEQMLEYMSGWAKYELQELDDAHERAKVCGLADDDVRKGVKAIVLSEPVELSSKKAQEVYDRGQWPRFYFTNSGKGGIRRKTYMDKVGGKPATNYWPFSETGHTDEAKKDLLSIFGGKSSFDTPKPHRLIERVLQIASNPDSIILDSFAGSGTTAHSVLNMNKADGGHRKFILVEMMDYADSITAERIKRVIRGYGEGKNAVEGTGGNFSFYDLGEPLLVGDCLNEAVATEKIREYIWFMETKTPYTPPAGDNPYYLGKHNSTGYYFYYEPQCVTVLDYAFLATIKEKADGTVIYADRCSIGEDKLAQMGITFKKIPRDISRL
ncbi:site-specific DNA-methyltransferase [Dysosmobacter sp.]|uniref:site-specific DNA-methyltransferase n=1 Tax=Dysosmobacter sp. TaxID=2591382 RepID=UPI002A83A8C2|nr:site-specific DNA-methyltransferase [Dysosmobacter sp.]MCI6936763.1 site-specific DNA-methyltransferase [Clostridiales bacterium]MDY3652203.1 site-specific DNA-methyltransferase [Dysosmobacter sp.]